MIKNFQRISYFFVLVAFVYASSVSHVYASAGSLDATFDPGDSFNNTVNTLAIQSDGKILVGGFFTSFDGTGRNRIARLNTDGSLDETFDPGTGFNSTVRFVSLQQDGKILVAGNFTSFNGDTRNYIARLNTDGSLDETFDPPGQDLEQGTGINGEALGVIEQGDGKIVVVGRFSVYGSTSRNYIVRLNSDGSLDVSFDPGDGFNGDAFFVSLQSDGKVIVAGDFDQFNGTGRGSIARLNPNGSLDVSFDPGTGFDDIAHSVAIQDDGKILVGGWFNSFNGTDSYYIARLNTDGSLDNSFDTGDGFGYVVNAILVQTDGKIIVGGAFDSYDNVESNYIARLNTSGSLDTSFNIGEGFSNSLRALALQSDEKLIAAGSFDAFNGVDIVNIVRLETVTVESASGGGAWRRMQTYTPVYSVGSYIPPSSTGGGTSSSTSSSTTISGGSATTTTITTPILPLPTPTPVFTKNLYTGITDPEVKLLQIYLNTHGYPVSTTGPGSPGSETDFFGSLTRSALSRFQAANNITPSVGYFGPITRAFVNSQQ